MKKGKTISAVFLFSLGRFMIFKSSFRKKSDGRFFKEEGYKVIMERSDSVLKQERLYLNSNLNMDTLAKRVGTNRSYLSKSIKIVKKTSYPKYINLIRVEYAKSLMATELGGCAKGIKSSAMSVDDYAVASGFGSTKKFIRYFKEQEGVTPSRYISALVWKVRR